MLKVYEENHVFKALKDQYATKTSIEDTDTFGAASRYKNACCLNFASHRRPGGGYKAVEDIPAPIKTQEEDLFRRSNLPAIMDTPLVRKHYPLFGCKGIYCNDVVVEKDQRLSFHTPFVTSLVTVPAVVNPQPHHADTVTAKARRIFNIAAENNHDVIILGAWGCGVFNNDPITVSSLFKQLIETEFKGVFAEVVYAIPGKQSPNYKIFESVVCQ